VESIFLTAADYLNQAVTGLREAGQQILLPNGLFARAFLYRVQQDFSRAWDDLAEAQEIAERGDMKLHLVDYHLEACRLMNVELRMLNDEFYLFRVGEKLSRERLLDQFQNDLQTTKEMIEKTGYHRRDPEVLLLEAQLYFARGDRNNAAIWLKKAKDKFGEMGIRMWDHALRELEACSRSQGT
jgi:tetratricopeptide (TPR) repeat protein